jgi:putative ABC transport system permease protein
MASFAALALVLAAVGLYGLLAYSVAQRSHEIGIRMALGAQQSEVLQLIVRNGIRLVIIGETIGAIAGLAFKHAASGLLYGVNPRDPGILGAALGLLTLVALAASYIPARRAAKLDPIATLHYQ